MEKTFFTMRSQGKGKLKYLLLSAAPSLVIGFLVGWDAAALVFVLLACSLLIPRNHSVVVFEQSMTEKDSRDRFIRKVTADQIACYRRNFLDEIVLEDADSKMLLCVESSMTNRDRFEQWLAAHHIESK